MSRESIRARVAAATDGPWTQSGTPRRRHWYVSSPEVIVHGPALREEPDTVQQTLTRWKADAAFIAHARQDIPALLDIADKAAAVIEELSSDDLWGPHGLALRDALAALEEMP